MPKPYSKKWFADMAERAGWTFVQAALAAAPFEVLASGEPAAWRVALVGGVAATLSFLKSVAAKRLGGDPESASTANLSSK